MIYILEKDNATIITIEEATNEEKSLIIKAKQMSNEQRNKIAQNNKKIKLNSVFDKFKCNHETNLTDEEKDLIGNINDFEPI